LFDVCREIVLPRRRRGAVPNLDVSEDQILGLLDQLSPSARKEALRKLLTEPDWLQRAADERNQRRIEELARARGVDWSALDDAQRQALVDEILHE
jgi:hypothetical protein